jgi:hypothetical protein
MATGSTLWGAVAARLGTGGALGIAGAGMVLGLLAMLRYPVAVAEGASLAPSRHWPAPLLAIEPEPDRGPVLVTVEYRVDPARAGEFVRAMYRLARSRRRGGAIRWGLWQDVADPERWLESFVDESWLEHLRHHERVTAQDADIEEGARIFHRGPERPRVFHYVAGRLRSPGS